MKKCFILKFVLVFSISTPTLGQWQGGRGNVCGSCVPWLSLSRCRFIERREKGVGREPFGPRRFRFLLLNVRTNFYEYCVCFAVVVVVGGYNLPVSPLTPPSSLSCCSPCHSHSFKHFMIFYLFFLLFSLSVVFCMRCVVENSENYA